MATKKSLRVLFGICVISVWVLGAAMQAGAETLHYKVYTYVTKWERTRIDDVEGHTVAYGTRGTFWVFDNGEVATTRSVVTNDMMKGAGSFMQYTTVKFEDGSTILYKAQGTTGGTATGSSGSAASTSEIIKGTGRFEGITGTTSSKLKYLPVPPGEAAQEGYGEGTITYTLPSK